MADPTAPLDLTRMASDRTVIGPVDVSDHLDLGFALAGRPRCVAWTGPAAPTSLLASGHADGRIVIRDGENLDKIELTIDIDALPVNALAWSPDGTHLAAATRDLLGVWDARSGESLFATSHKGDLITSIDWSAAGASISVAGRLTVETIDPVDGSVLTSFGYSGSSGFVRPVAWSPDGEHMAFATDTDDLSVWNVRTGDVIRPLLPSAPTSTLAWGPDGLLAVGAVDGSTVVLSVDDGARLHALVSPVAHRVTSLAWARDRALLAIGHRNGRVRVWNLMDAPFEMEDAGPHAGGVDAVAWSSDASTVASVGDDGTLGVISPGTAVVSRTLGGHSNDHEGVAWSPDGEAFASAGPAEASVWTVTPMERRTSLGVIAPGSPIAWSPDGGFLAVAEHLGGVGIWTAERDLTRRLRLTEDMVDSFAWSPDGRYIAIAADSSPVENWSVLYQERMAEIGPTACSVAWSPEGSRVALAHPDGTVDVWPTDGGPRLVDLPGFAGSAESVAWSPDGSRIAAVGEEGRGEIWRVDDETVPLDDQIPERVVLAGHTGLVFSVAWSDDGTLVTTVGDDGTARVWDPTTGNERNRWRSYLPLMGGDRLIAFQPGSHVVVIGGSRLLLADADDDEQEPIAPLLVTVRPRDTSTTTGGRTVAGTRPLTDRAATDDLLDRRPLASYLALTFDEIVLPTPRSGFVDEPASEWTVLIDAPWGAGKSTLTNLLCQELSRTGRHPWVLPPAPFDAWRESRVGPSWWSLVSWLRREVRRSLPTRRARAWFSVTEAFERARRRATMVAFVLLFVAILLGVGWWLSGNPWTPASPPTTTATPVTNAAAPGVTAPTPPPTTTTTSPPAIPAQTSRAVTSARDLVTGIAAIVATLLTAWLALSRILLWYSPLGGRLLQKTDGDPMSEIVGHALWLRRRLPGPLLWIVDDLDRCDSADAVDLLEAIQNLLRPPDPHRAVWSGAPPGQPPRRAVQPIVFVVPADARWICNAFEVEHGAAQGRMGDVGRPLGSLFVDKLFQLRVTLPRAGRRSLNRFDRSALGIADGGASPTSDATGLVASPLPDPSTPAAGAPRASTSDSSSDGTQADVWATFEALLLAAPFDELNEVLATVPKVYEGRATILVASLDAEALANGRAEHRLAPYFAFVEANPRTRTRFVNAWSARTASLRGMRDIPADVVARWTIIDLHWPGFAAAVEASPDLIDEVERAGPRTADDPQARWTTVLRDSALIDVVTKPLPGMPTTGSRPVTADDLRRLFGQ